MARPTHDEIIRELTKDVAILDERVNGIRDEIKELKRGLEESARRRWSLLPPIIGAAVGVILSALVAYIIARL